jgi:hypothetical protein
MSEIGPRPTVDDFSRATSWFPTVTLFERAKALAMFLGTSAGITRAGNRFDLVTPRWGRGRHRV